MKHFHTLDNLLAICTHASPTVNRIFAYWLTICSVFRLRVFIYFLFLSQNERPGCDWAFAIFNKFKFSLGAAYFFFCQPKGESLKRRIRRKRKLFLSISRGIGIMPVLPEIGKGEIFFDKNKWHWKIVTINCWAGCPRKKYEKRRFRVIVHYFFCKIYPFYKKGMPFLLRRFFNSICSIYIKIIVSIFFFNSERTLFILNTILLRIPSSWTFCKNDSTIIFFYWNITVN